MSTRIVLCSFFIPTRFSAYYYRAAKRIQGLDVVTIGPTSGGSPAWGDDFQFPEHAIAPDFQIWDPDQVEEAGKQALLTKPDLWVDVDGAMFANVPRGTLPCPHAVVATDPHIGGEYWAYGRQREVADFFFNPLKEYLRPGDHYLPAAYDHAFYRDPKEKASAAATVLGAPYPKRLAVAQKLKDCGVAVYANPGGYGGVYDAYRKELHKAHVAVVWPFRRDLSCRVFEAAACGRALVYPESIDKELHEALGAPANLQLGRTFDDLDCGALDPWKERSKDEAHAVGNAVQQVTLLVDNPGLRLELANRIHAAVQPHTWENRLRQIVRTCLGREI